MNANINIINIINYFITIFMYRMMKHRYVEVYIYIYITK